MTRNMLLCAVCLGLLAGFAALTAGANEAGGADDPAAAHFQEGQVLLAQGDFDQALRQYALAARADSGNTLYREQYAVLRQVVRMRASFDQEPNPTRWEATARALRAFYVTNQLYGEALPVARQLHERLQTVESAAILADAMLALDMNAPAAELLTKLEAEKHTPMTRLQLALAQARLNQPDAARQNLAQAALPAQPGWDLLICLAQVQMRLGQTDEAMGSLTRAFQLTPPSSLDIGKDFARSCQDFAAVAQSERFAQVLATETTITESDCTGGSSCGTCRHSSSCGTTAAASGSAN